MMVKISWNGLKQDPTSKNLLFVIILWIYTITQFSKKIRVLYHVIALAIFYDA